MNCFGGTPGELQVSRKKRQSRPAERHDPQQAATRDRDSQTRAGVSGNEDRSTLLKGVTHIIQYENSTSFEHIESFIHPEMSVDRNARTGHHLLGPQREIVRARSGTRLDENLAMVAKMNQLFASGQEAKHISLGRYGLAPGSCPAAKT